jgi:protein TonB
MNEVLQRLLPASLLTLALHSVFLSHQMQKRPDMNPPTQPLVQKISVTLKQPPPPPPPQKKIVKELPPPPEIQPVERKPLETLPPEQKKIVKQRRKPPTVKLPVQRKPLEQLPPAQSKIARRLPRPPAVTPAALKPMEALPPVQHRIARALSPPPIVVPAATPQPLTPLPPAQGRIFRQLPQLPTEVTAAQTVPQPLTTLPPQPEPEEVLVEEVPMQEDILIEDDGATEQPIADEIVQDEPVDEEMVADNQPADIIEEASVIEEEVFIEPPPHRIVRSGLRSIQQERHVRPTDSIASQSQHISRRQTTSAASYGTGDQEAAPLYASNPPPEYPPQARRRGLQGVVIIEALIDVSGRVADLRPFSSSGHSILDKAALNAVRSWRFTAGIVGGKRKEMWVKVPVRFELN